MGLKKTRFRGDLIKGYKYLKGGWSHVLLSGAQHQGTKQWPQTETQEVLNIEKHFFTIKVTKRWRKVAQRGSGVSVHADIMTREAEPGDFQRYLGPHWDAVGLPAKA